MAPKKDPNFGLQGKEGGMGGKYARKAANLSAAELKKAGATKAAAARTVDISQTKRATGTGKTLGPGGKPLTGTVKMSDGSLAVYKGGVRVRATAPSASKPSVSSAKKPTTPPKKVVSAKSSSATQKSLTASEIRRRTGYGVGGAQTGKPSVTKPTTSVSGNKGPRRPGESVGAYNDRIRNAPLADWFANLGKGGRTPISRNSKGKAAMTAEEAMRNARNKGKK